MRAALDFLSGDDSAETLAELRAGLRRWAASDDAGRRMGLHRYLGIGSAQSLRLVLRDALVREAADLIEAGSVGERARLLAKQVKDLEKEWRHWRQFAEAPARASAVLRVLWRARCLGRIPQTSRALVDIIG